MMEAMAERIMMAWSISGIIGAGYCLLNPHSSRSYPWTEWPRHTISFSDVDGRTSPNTATCWTRPDHLYEVWLYHGTRHHNTYMVRRRVEGARLDGAPVGGEPWHQRTSNAADIVTILRAREAHIGLA